MLTNVNLFRLQFPLIISEGTAALPSWRWPDEPLTIAGKRRCDVLLGRALWPLLLSSGVVIAQSPSAANPPQPPSYANYSIMLVNPAGGAVVLMHNPQNALEFVDVNGTKTAFANGYVPVRAAELGELITALEEENENLKADNAKLRTAQPSQQLNEANCHDWSWLVAANDEQRQTCATRFYSPSPAQLRAQQKAQDEVEKRERSQQLIQAWLMLQALRPPTQPYQLPMPVNSNAGRLRTNCTTQTLGNTSTTNCN